MKIRHLSIVSVPFEWITMFNVEHILIFLHWIQFLAWVLPLEMGFSVIWLWSIFSEAICIGLMLFYFSKKKVSKLFSCSESIAKIFVRMKTLVKGYLFCIWIDSCFFLVSWFRLYIAHWVYKWLFVWKHKFNLNVDTIISTNIAYVLNVKLEPTDRIYQMMI